MAAQLRPSRPRVRVSSMPGAPAEYSRARMAARRGVTSVTVCAISSWSLLRRWIRRRPTSSRGIASTRRSTVRRGLTSRPACPRSSGRQPSSSIRRMRRQSTLGVPAYPISLPSSSLRLPAFTSQPMAVRAGRGPSMVSSALQFVSTSFPSIRLRHRIFFSAPFSTTGKVSTVARCGSAPRAPCQHDAW